MRQLVPSHKNLRKLNILVVFSLCLSAVLFTLHELNYPLTGIDDANIYLVYARNLADGHGFVYNIGGERVEGFTSPLWTLLSALAVKFTPQPELALLVFNIILVSLGITCALEVIQQPSAGETKKRGTGLVWSALFLIIIFTSPRYIVWNTITLMENALWSTLLVIATVLVIRDEKLSKAINTQFLPVSILLLLTRPESILWVPVFLGMLFLRLTFTGRFTSTLKTLAPSIVGILLCLALVTLFRLQYFGYPLPNTYYAKVSPSFAYNLEQGALYLIRYFLSDPIAAVGIISILLTCIHSILSVSPGKGIFYLPWIAATGLLVPIFAGGDHFGSFRFYQNVYPIIILCMIHFARHVFPGMVPGFPGKNTPARFHILVFPALVLLVSYGFVTSQVKAWSGFPPEIKTEFSVAEYERRNGAFIQDLFSSLPRLPRVGVIAAGGIKLSYDGEIVDLMGLNNTVMAHNQGDRVGHRGHAAFEVGTFFKLQPEIVWPFLVNDEWQYSEAELKGRWENTLGFKGLFNDPHFLERYQYAKVHKVVPSQNRIALVAWFRKDFLESLAASGDFVLEQYPYEP
jgi:arabinofuranosyltransferase